MFNFQLIHGDHFNTSTRGGISTEKQSQTESAGDPERVQTTNMLNSWVFLLLHLLFLQVSVIISLLQIMYYSTAFTVQLITVQ